MFLRHRRFLCLTFKRQELARIEAKESGDDVTFEKIQ